MPGLNRVNSFGRPNPNQDRGANDVANEREECADDDQNNAARNFEGIKFAKEKRDHQRGLERTNTATSFLDPDKAAAEFDHISVLKRGNARELQEDDIDRGDDAHQVLNHDLLDSHGPRHSDEKKQNRKGKVIQPTAAAD